jgi:uncharacterized protein DUF1360
MSFTTILIASLATYRIVRIILLEDGPFDVFITLRGWLDPDARTWLGKGMRCSWCLSFWVAPALVYAATYTAGLILIGGLAVSALASLGMTYGPVAFDRWRRGK